MKSLLPGQLDELLRAVSHSDRRTFLRLCRDQEVSAGELAESSALALASVSEHLKVLRKTGLLVQKRRGRFLLYRTDSTLLRKIIASLIRLEER